MHPRGLLEKLPDDRQTKGWKAFAAQTEVPQFWGVPLLLAERCTSGETCFRKYRPTMLFARSLEGYVLFPGVSAGLLKLRGCRHVR